jgi:hypothetical protein
MIESPVRWGVGVAVLTVLAGCSASKPTQVVTVTRTQSPPASTTAPATQPAPTASADPSHSPATTALSDLPGTCDTLLDDSSVLDAAGVDSLPGKDAFVVGKADPVIHRLAYVNCRYGVTGKGGTGKPAIEIGVSLYATSEDAAQRITATVDDYAAHGATTTAVQVLGKQATLITGGAGAGYDVPTLVVAAGQRTVAVSIDDAVAPAAKVADPAVAITKLALQRSAG